MRNEANLPVRPSTLRQFMLLLKKDLMCEVRTKDMLASMVIYAVLVLLVYGIACAASNESFEIEQIAAGLMWALILFTSLLGLNRSFLCEIEQESLEGILLVPMDRGAIYLAKACANFIFLSAIECVVVPLFWLFFLLKAQTPVHPFSLSALLIAGNAGIAGIGTLLSTITVRTRGRDVLLAVLLIPLLFPLLYACVMGTSAILSEPEAWQDTAGISCAVGYAYDVIMILLSWILYDFVVSA